MEGKKKSSKKWIVLVVAVLLLCGAAIINAMGNRKDRVQELLDLGQSYLEDGEYEQAIATLESILDIEPKEIRSEESLAILENPDTVMELIADAYIAWTDDEIQEKNFEHACSLLKEGKEKTGDDRLDDKLVEAYIAWADDEIEKENYDEAQEILEEGWNETEAKEIKKKLKELYEILYPNGENASVTLEVEGTVFDNSITYEAQWDSYISQYRDSVSIIGYGIRFSEPITTQIAGEEISVSEAEVVAEDDQIKSLLYGGELTNRNIKMKGYIEARGTEEQGEIITGTADGTVYHPNGKYDFYVTEIVE